MTQPKSLIDWLNSQSEASIKILTGFDTSVCFKFQNELSRYGLAAFEKLSPELQLHILNQYCYVFNNVATS